MDRATIAGIVISVGSILTGMVVEGGRLTDILQVTAGLIVVGGTVGAVLVSSPPSVFVRAVKKLPQVFLSEPIIADSLVDRLTACSVKARRRGIVSLEEDAALMEDPFFRKALKLTVDGVGSDVLRENMELEIALEEQRLDQEARVLEAAGGYAPTIGIIGAVLGLIQVMKHLDRIGDVGHGIAVAFVSTVYGVGLANLILLPAAGKLRALAEHQIRMRELVLEGVLAIAEGRNPRLIRNKLEAYITDEAPEQEAEPARPFVVNPGAEQAVL